MLYLNDILLYKEKKKSNNAYLNEKCLIVIGNQICHIFHITFQIWSNYKRINAIIVNQRMWLNSLELNLNSIIA